MAEDYDPGRVHTAPDGSRYRLSRTGARVPADEFVQPSVPSLFEATLARSPLDRGKRARLLAGRLRAAAELLEASAVLGHADCFGDLEKAAERAWCAFHDKKDGTMVALTLMEALFQGGQLLKAGNDPEDARHVALLGVSRFYPDHARSLSAIDLSGALAAWGRKRGNQGRATTKVNRFKVAQGLLRDLGLQPPTASRLETLWKTSTARALK